MGSDPPLMSPPGFWGGNFETLEQCLTHSTHSEFSWWSALSAELSFLGKPLSVKYLLCVSPGNSQGLAGTIKSFKNRGLVGKSLILQTIGELFK